MEWPGPRSGTNWGGPLPAHAGEHVATTEVRKWHIASVSAVQRHVWSWGKTGSNRTTVKMALMTHSRRPAVLKYYRWFRSSKLPQG